MKNQQISSIFSDIKLHFSKKRLLQTETGYLETVFRYHYQAYRIEAAFIDL